MENITKDKKEYLKRWFSYINGLQPLCFVHDDKLSKQVSSCIKKLKKLVKLVAEQKNLK